MPAAVEEGDAASRDRAARRADGASSPPSHGDGPVGVGGPQQPGHQRGQPVRRGTVGDVGGELQHGRRRVGAVVDDDADLLDGDAVDGADLLRQQVDGDRLRQRHDELVDDATAAALEDVDGRDVAVDGADAAGDLAEGAGPVGQPDPHDQRARRRRARRADRRRADALIGRGHRERRGRADAGRCLAPCDERRR